MVHGVAIGARALASDWASTSRQTSGAGSRHCVLAAECYQCYQVAVQGSALAQGISTFGVRYGAYKSNRCKVTANPSKLLARFPTAAGAAFAGGRLTSGYKVVLLFFPTSHLGGRLAYTTCIYFHPYVILGFIVSRYISFFIGSCLQISITSASTPSLSEVDIYG